MKLIHKERSCWEVAGAKVPGFDVVVHIRSFPGWATDHEMRAALSMINLAYMLNASAHLGMSYLGGNGNGEDSTADQQERKQAWAQVQEQFGQKLRDLFIQYPRY